MVLLFVLSTIFILIVSLLFVPIVILIDTVSNQYYVQLKGLIKADFEKHDDYIFRIRMKVLLFNFFIYPLKKKHLNNHNRTKNHHFEKSIKHPSISRIIRVIKTFKIKRIFIDLDTSDYILNAKLYPLFILINYNKDSFYINFQGRNQLILLIKNKPINIITSYINF